MRVSDPLARTAIERLVALIQHEAYTTGSKTGRPVLSARVLDALRRVPRDRFVPQHERDAAWDDAPLAIGFGQTISQPFIVALMTDLADIEPGQRVLEIGTGSGYQAAILAELGADVCTVERIADLADAARARLVELGYDRVEVRVGDGNLGVPELAPFDAILVTAATPRIPAPLLAQLAIGGRLVIPLGGAYERQVLERIVRTDAHHHQREHILDVAFVPLLGGIVAPTGRAS